MESECVDSTPNKGLCYCLKIACFGNTCILENAPDCMATCEICFVLEVDLYLYSNVPCVCEFASPV